MQNQDSRISHASANGILTVKLKGRVDLDLWGSPRRSLIPKITETNPNISYARATTVFGAGLLIPGTRQIGGRDATMPGAFCNEITCMESQLQVGIRFADKK